MRMNINDFFAESFIAEIRKMNSSPRSQNNQRSDSPVTLRNFTENQESLFVPKLKGTQIINFMPPIYYFARTNTCNKYLTEGPLLKKIGTTIDLILSHCSMSSQLFFPLLTDQLILLERFMSTTTSRIVVSEIVEKVLQSLVALKNVFIKLSDGEIRDTFYKTVSHRNSPRRNQRNDRSLGAMQSRGNNRSSNK